MRNTSAAGFAGSCRISRDVVFIYIGEELRITYGSSLPEAHFSNESIRLTECWHEFSCEAGWRFEF